MDKVPVRIMLTGAGGVVPTYAKRGDAGADVYAAPSKLGEEEVARLNSLNSYLDEKDNHSSVCVGDYSLLPGQTILVDLRIRIELPTGWEMQVRSRSGLAKRGIVVANAPGTIDSGYRGPCMVLLRNDGECARVIRAGTRVAQFVVKRAPQAEFTVVRQLTSSDRGEGGFGSTGT